jgi:hypothetical protein
MQPAILTELSSLRDNGGNYMVVSMTQRELVSISMLTVSLWIIHAEYLLPRLTLYTEHRKMRVCRTWCSTIALPGIVMRILLVRTERYAS